MKILAVQASPNVDGLTAKMAKEAMAGAQAAKAEVELLNLCQMKLGACRQCDDGWGKCRREGLCIIEDDLELLREKMAQADGLILSTPVYFGDLAEVVKGCLDRLRRCEVAGPDEPRVAGRWLLAIAAAGGGGGGGPTCLNAMERYCSTLGWRVFDTMIVTQRSRSYMLPAARQAGERMIRHMEEQQKT